MLAARVAEAVAHEWSVPPGSVHVAWGRMAAPLPSDPGTPFRLTGRGADGWYVAVFESTRERAAVRVRAGVMDTVAVAARPLSAGARVQASDLRYEPRLSWGPPATRRGGLAAPGFEIRRAIASGEVVAWPAVAPPTVVLAGAPVRLEWSRAGVRVSLEGVALNSARAGEIVRARVADRTGHVTGVATAPGVVALQGGLDR